MCCSQPAPPLAFSPRSGVPHLHPDLPHSLSLQTPFLSQPRPLAPASSPLGISLLVLLLGVQVLVILSSHIFHSHLLPDSPGLDVCLGSLSAVWFCSLGTRWPHCGPGHKLSHPTQGMYPAKITSRPFAGAWHMEVMHIVGFRVIYSAPSVPSPYESLAPRSRAHSS